MSQVPMPSMPLPPASRTGPLGTPRSVGTSILLAIVTLGIYTYVWTTKTHGEMKRHTGEGLGGGLGFVVYLFVSPVTWFLIPAEIKGMHEQRGMPSPVRPLMGLWFLLPLIGAFIWFSKVQGALNAYWTSQGASRP